MQLAALQKEREELELNLQATKSILEETRAVQNQTQEDRNKIQARLWRSHACVGAAQAKVDGSMLGHACACERVCALVLRRRSAMSS